MLHQLSVCRQHFLGEAGVLEFAVIPVVVDPVVVTPNIAAVTAASLALCISWLFAPALLLLLSLVGGVRPV